MLVIFFNKLLSYNNHLLNYIVADLTTVGLVVKIFI